jgi:ABC-type transporter Mla MlaB component
MLRITTNNCPQALTLRLEGRLEGPWVAVLTQSWGGALLNLNGRQLRIDLNDVTFIDAQGRARLAEMYAQGAEFVAGDLETKAIVAELRTRRAIAADGESSQQ